MLKRQVQGELVLGSVLVLGPMRTARPCGGRGATSSLGGGFTHKNNYAAPKNSVERLRLTLTISRMP